MHGKGALQMWFRVWRWEDYLGLLGRAQCNHKGPSKRQEGQSKAEEMGGRGRSDPVRKQTTSQEGGQPPNLEKGRKWILPSSLLKVCSLTVPLFWSSETILESLTSRSLRVKHLWEPQLQLQVGTQDTNLGCVVGWQDRLGTNFLGEGSGWV